MTGKEGALRDSQTWELGDSLNGGVRSSHSSGFASKFFGRCGVLGSCVSTTVLAVGVPSRSGFDFRVNELTSENFAFLR